MQDQSAQPRAFENDHLERLAKLTYDEAGLIIEPNKMAMVQSRLRHRLMDLNMPDFASYCSFVCSDSGETERRNLISALTTNVSGFFREKHHFDILRDQVFPEIAARLQAGGRGRIWSAGCSNGQEPLSIAMLAQETDPIFARTDFKILATDIDPAVLATCRAGQYSDSLLGGVSEERLARFFTQVGEDTFEAVQSLRDMIAFKELNLMRQWPMSGSFDAIFCRNVVIYFDAETQAMLWPRFHAKLTQDGWMFLGHSERIVDAGQNNFKSVGPTTYRVAPTIGTIKSKEDA